jgi:hypothetical protein
MNRTFLLTGLIVLLLSSCTTTRYPGTGGPDDRGNYPFPESERRERKGSDDGKVYPFGSLGIPKGHLPPPGECKIWIPGKEPGQQGPPQSCASAIRNAPLGAWVITHEGSRYRVNIFNRVKRSVIDEVRYYTLGQ